MSTKPLLLLDVDGVVNAFSPDRPHTVHTVDFGRTNKGVPQSYTLHFDNEVVMMIEALQDHFDVVWCTMWNQSANSRLAPLLGIEDMPVMHCSHDAGLDVLDGQGIRWEGARRLWYAKTPLIPSYVGDTPFVWIDDDHSDADRRYLDAQMDQPFRLIKTDAYDGLTWDDVNAAIVFARTLNPTSV